MLNRDFRFTAGSTNNTVGIIWTAPADDSISFVFVNANLEVENYAPGQGERHVDIAWKSTGPPVSRVVEIHDFAPADAPDEPFPAITVPPEAFTLPIIRFSTVVGAARYRLYHRPQNANETLSAEFMASDFEGEWAEIPAREILDARTLAGKWHFFRIESVSEYGVESHQKSWAWRAMDTAHAPTVSVASGSAPGLYTFHVT